MALPVRWLRFFRSARVKHALAELCVLLLDEAANAVPRRATPTPAPTVPSLRLRYSVAEASRILGISRAKLYLRIQEGVIDKQKDGARTFITHHQIERYIEWCDQSQ